MQDAARARPSAPSTHVFVPIRVHSWFSLFPPPSCFFRVFRVFRGLNTAWTTLFAYSRPFVSIRGSPSSPFFVFFVYYVSIRGSITAWTTFFAYSCPFVSIRGSPSSPPSCISCFFVVQTLFVQRAMNQFEARTNSACSAVKLCFASYGMIFPETRLQLSRILT